MSSRQFLEVRQPNSSGDGVQNPIVHQAYLGELDLTLQRLPKSVAVSINHGNFFDYQNVYVKVKLCTNQRSGKKVKRTDFSDSAIWNKTWNIKCKRFNVVQIAVWNLSSQYKNAPNLIGCMSFTIPSEEGTFAHGSYYLLHRSIGCSKHLRVVHDRLPFAEHDKLSAKISATSSSDMTMLASYSTTKVATMSSSDSYGLKLAGEAPSYICRVIHSSIAHRAGLQINDKIVAINGLDVSYTDARTVSSFIKNAKGDVTLTFQRVPVLPVLRLDSPPSVRELSELVSLKSNDSIVSEAESVKPSTPEASRRDTTVIVDCTGITPQVFDMVSTKQYHHLTMNQICNTAQDFLDLNQSIRQ